jgi:hypothetical protein
VPFIVRYPGMVTPGSVSDALVHQADLGELRNLAAAEPARVAALKAAYETLVTAGRSRPKAPRPSDGGGGLRPKRVV